MAANKVKHAIGFIAAAHRCEASHERYRQAVEQAREQVPHAPSVEYVKPWSDHPLFINAMAERVKEVAAPANRELDFHRP